MLFSWMRQRIQCEVEHAPTLPEPYQLCSIVFLLSFWLTNRVSISDNPSVAGHICLGYTRTTRGGRPASELRARIVAWERKNGSTEALWAYISNERCPFDTRWGGGEVMHGSHPCARYRRSTVMSCVELLIIMFFPIVFFPYSPC